MAQTDFLKLAGVRYQVDSATCRRGTVRPNVERFALGDQLFTGGTPPFAAKGQAEWGGGFQVKRFKASGHSGFRSSANIDTQWRDRVTLANDFSTTVYDTTKTSVKLCKVPFNDVFFAYSTATNHAWYKDGSNAWTALTIPTTGTFGATAPTGWLSDTIGPVGKSGSQTIYFLMGSANGHVMKVAVSGTTGSKTVTASEVGRPLDSTPTPDIDCYGGIYDMQAFQGALYLAGQDSSSNPVILTYNGNSTTGDVNKVFGPETMHGTRVQLIFRRYVESDQNPDQLHWVMVQQATNAGTRATHFMWPGTGNARELRTWLDNYPLCAAEYDVTGSKGIVFGMARLGQVWRYSGDYSEILRLDTPDNAYSTGINSLTQYGRFIVCPVIDTTYGMSLMFYDGQAWWQGPSIKTAAVAQTPDFAWSGEGNSVGVYRDTLFTVHKATNAGSIYELNTSAFQTSGILVTSLIHCDYPETPKEWLKLRVNHSPLAASQSLQAEYSLDDASNLAFADSFENTNYRDATNDTTTWDTANGLITVPGAAAKNFVGINNGSTTHIAYKYQHADPTSLTPATIAAAATEFSNSNYDGIEADDSSTTATGSTTGTLDQSNTTATTSSAINASNQSEGQTFTAGSTGTLSAVILKLLKSSGNIVCQVKIYATSGGLPTGAALATSDQQTVTDTSATEYTFSFASPASLTSGTVYALAVHFVSGTGNLGVSIHASSVYASGQNVYSNDSGTTWTARSTYDLYFKTYLSGTFGKAIQLARFLVAGTLNTIPVRAISTSAGGFTTYIYNHNTLAWEQLDTTTSSSEDTQTGTISTNPTYYRDGSNYISVMLVSAATGTNATAATLTTDFIRLDGSYTTSTLTARSLTVDSASSGIATATATITTNGSGTYTLYLSNDGGSTWEAATTGVQLTFASAAGSALRWRVDIAAADASTQPQLTNIAITYSTGYVSLGTVSTAGSTQSEFWFSDQVYSRLLQLRFTLAGPGTTTPQLYSYAVEFLYSPDVKEIFKATLVLEDGYEYSDGTTESRTPAQQYAAILALRTTKSKPSFEWVTGETKTSVTFESGFFDGDLSGIPSESDEEVQIKLPVALVEVRA